MHIYYDLLHIKQFYSFYFMLFDYVCPNTKSCVCWILYLNLAKKKYYALIYSWRVIVLCLRFVCFFFAFLFCCFSFWFAFYYCFNMKNSAHGPTNCVFGEICVCIKVAEHFMRAFDDDDDRFSPFHLEYHPFRSFSLLHKCEYVTSAAEIFLFHSIFDKLIIIKIPPRSFMTQYKLMVLFLYVCVWFSFDFLSRFYSLRHYFSSNVGVYCQSECFVLVRCRQCWEIFY